MLAVLFECKELNEKVSMYRDVKQKTLSFANLKHRYKAEDTIFCQSKTQRLHHWEVKNT